MGVTVVFDDRQQRAQSAASPPAGCVLRQILNPKLAGASLGSRGRPAHCQCVASTGIAKALALVRFSVGLPCASSPQTWGTGRARHLPQREQVHRPSPRLGSRQRERPSRAFGRSSLKAQSRSAFGCSGPDLGLGVDFGVAGSPRPDRRTTQSRDTAHTYRTATRRSPTECHFLQVERLWLLRTSPRCPWVAGESKAQIRVLRVPRVGACVPSSPAPDLGDVHCTQTRRSSTPCAFRGPLGHAGTVRARRAQARPRAGRGLTRERPHRGQHFAVTCATFLH